MILRWVAYAACVGLFVHALMGTDIRAAWGRLRMIGPLAILGLVPYPFALISDATSLRRLLAALGQKVPLSTLVRIRFVTEAVTNSMPAGPVWADALAPVLVSRRTHVSISDVVAASTAKRWLLVRMHSLYVFGSAALGFHVLSNASRHLVGSDLLVLVVFAGSLWLVLLATGFEALAVRAKVGGRLSRFLGKTGLHRVQRWIETRQHHFTNADAQIAALSADRRASIAASAGVLGLWLVEGFETFLLLHLLGANLGLVTVMSFDAALSILRSTAFFAPAGIGVQDVGYLTVLEAYGVPESSGIAPAFIVLKRTKEVFWILVGFIVLARTGGKVVLQREAQDPSAAT
jgi:lysylphosphatidylglycerol synthase-like protein